MCRDRSQCIHETEILNGFAICRDDSDEDIYYHKDWNCTEGHMKCASGDECIEMIHICDGYGEDYRTATGCKDGSDEKNCDRWECVLDYWKCMDNTDETNH